MKKIAIIGLGKWGRILLKEFYKKTNISICVSKGNKKNISWLHKHYPNIKHSKNYQDILDDVSIDAVVISTPISTHYSLIHDALNSGKHVFTEKPLSEIFSNAKSLQSIAIKKNLCLFVGHSFIYHPVLNKIKKLIKNDPILYFSMKWHKFGTFEENIFLNLLSHEISILLELIGLPKKITIISSKGVISNQDILIVKVHFSKTCNGVILIDRTSNNKEKTISLISKNQFLLWNDYDLYKLNKKTQKFNKIFHSNKNSISNEIDEFINNMKMGQSDKHNLQIATDTVKLVSKLVN
jgi:predicted dehydrogenase